MKNLSKKLTSIALGDYYSEDALKEALKIPFLTWDDQKVIYRYLLGTQQGTDAVSLQSLAVNLEGHQRTEPKDSTYYKPLESPNAYPLELTENLHICLWDEEGKYKWTIALWHKGKEGYSLEFIGARPLNERVKWKKLKAIIEQGQAIADKKFNADEEN